MRPHLATLCLLLALPSLGCAPSEEEVQADFDAFIDDHDHCAADDECAAFSPGCPLGCWVAVRSESLDEATELAADLIHDYERGGTQCDYECQASEPAVCFEGTCAICSDTQSGCSEDD